MLRKIINSLQDNYSKVFWSKSACDWRSLKTSNNILQEYNDFPLIVHILNGAIDLPCLNSYQLDCWEVIQHTKKDFCNNTTKYSYINNEWWKVDIDIYEDNNV